MEKNYFTENEEKGWELLQQLNNKYGYFTSLTHSPSGTTWDVSGYTRDGRRVIIELKTRNAILTEKNTVSGVNFNDNTLFIENNKFSILLMEHVVGGFIPLYINFLQDGNVVIHNLLRLTKYREDHKTKIVSRGYDKLGGYERNCFRLCLFLDDATIVKV